MLELDIHSFVDTNKSHDAHLNIPLSDDVKNMINNFYTQKEKEEMKPIKTRFNGIVSTKK